MTAPRPTRRSRPSFRRMLGLAAVLSALSGAAGAQDRPGQGVPPPVPDETGHIVVQADQRPFTLAYGAELANLVFSGRLGATRRAAVTASLARVPGFSCPGSPQVVLAAVFPWRGMGARRAWIERFAVACRPATLRNFLVFEEGGALRRAEMVPGASNADPLLQRDLLPGIAAAAARSKPAGCGSAPVVTDVSIAAPVDGSGAWRESWQVSQCDLVSAIEVRFAPSPRGGTTWSISGDGTP